MCELQTYQLALIYLPAVATQATRGCWANAQSPWSFVTPAPAQGLSSQSTTSTSQCRTAYAALATVIIAVSTLSLRRLLLSIFILLIFQHNLCELVHHFMCHAVIGVEDRTQNRLSNFGCLCARAVLHWL